MKSYVTIGAAMLLSVAAAAAQTPLLCDSPNQYSFCEIREITLPFSGSIDADTGGVGAIAVKGWDNAWVFVRARVSTSAGDEYQARLISFGVAIDTSSNRVWASGPSGQSWAVAYEVFVPRESALELNTRVGAIAIDGVAGKIHVKTAVGAVSLSQVAGEVDGETGVGAIAVRLAGDHWEGKGLTLRTGTGAIAITAPPDFNAHFELKTSLGAIVTDFPGAHPTSTSFLGRKVAFDAGAGGAPVQAGTAIGEISLKRAAADR